MATNALHVELATDLSTQTFLGALQRFITRMGRCSTHYNDCGTNVVGVAKFLKLILDYATNESFNWRFNPPSVPHCGDLWEAGIKFVKSHLARVIGDQILQYEELLTFKSNLC